MLAYFSEHLAALIKVARTRAQRVILLRQPWLSGPLSPEGLKQKRETGTSKWISRFDAVPIPEHLRKNLSPKAIMEIPVRTLANWRFCETSGSASAAALNSWPT